MTKSKKIYIFLNQLLESKLYTGGETRGAYILDYFAKDPQFDATLICPKVSQDIFSKYKVLTTGNIIPEPDFARQNLIGILFLYFVRAFESLRYINQLKNNYIYSNSDFICNTIPAFIVKFLYPKTKWTIIVHHINVNPFRRKSNKFIINVFSFLLQQFSFLLVRMRANLIFTDNHDVKTYLQSIGISKPIHVVGNALDVDQVLSDLSKLVNIKQKNQLYYFGRLSPTKGILDLPVIFSSVLKFHPNYQLHLIGHGTDVFLNELKGKFREHNCLKQVVFHGFLPYIDSYKIILSSKACLFPSYEEGWGISLFEAMICRRPVVMYDLPVYHELFGNNILTVKIGDTQQFANQVINILSNNNSLKVKKIVNHCYSVSLKYDWKNVYKTESSLILQIK